VHDLKNPLITILGFAGRIKDGKGDTGSAAQAIIDSAQSMQKIVYDVLDFSKPVQLELKEEDARHTIKQACDLYTTKAKEKNIELLVNFSDEQLITQIDSLRLQRSLVNLINNAIEASEKDQSIAISAKSGKDSLLIKITDHGSGMDKETLDNIFIPFYTKKGSGTGLGMSIARKIIEGHEGEISIKSQPGKGTEVTVRLPAGSLKK